ncbi:MAG: bifunctional diaminohydroxyphosphoribosylaminopyrimidine deaminase/5-amino-6-(5-phosphoribosylamino)uracil reductase RibD [Candidatus Omnitrophota bacterium]
MHSDEYFMRLALALALKAKGKTSPNPLVGAVIVKDNRIIGQGYHKKAGMPHAEVIALNQAGKRAKNATLYVNLEPCSHYGRTPPCIDKIIASEIKKVVIAMVDPNPFNNGKGIKLLRGLGVKVKTGVLNKEARDLNKQFIKYITKHLPYVTVKIAQSLDGKIATKNYNSKWITSAKARQFAHRLRDNFDAIILGTNTILKDNPNLKTKKAIRVIIDKDLKISQDLNLFNYRKTKIIIATRKINTNKQYPKNVELIVIKESDDKLDLVDLMRKLADKGIINILVEGGGELIGSLFDEKLVNEIKFFIAPKIIGGKSAISSITGQGIKNINSAIGLKDIKISNISKDLLVEAEVVYRDN